MKEEDLGRATFGPNGQMNRRTRFEHVAFAFGGQRSSQLSCE
jgi:hypothetical protein